MTTPFLSPDFPRAWLSRIEDATLNASAPPQQRWVDGWLARFNPGKAQRARSVNAVADGLLPLAERVALCERMYAQEAVPLIFRITPFTQPPGLDEHLAQAGFSTHDHSLVMVCPQLPAQAFSLPKGLQMERVSQEVYAHIIGEFRGSPVGERQAQAQRLQQAPVPHASHVLRDADGQPAACAQMTLEDGMAGLYDVFTRADWRGRGVARALCGLLLAQARAMGAQAGYLQVDAQNAAARRVYQGLGFQDGYGYHYRRR